MGKITFLPLVISNSYAWQKEHTRQLLRDASLDILQAAQHEPILEDCKNLDPIQPNPFRSARQDDHRISDCTGDCTGFVIPILGGADVAFRVLGVELQTVLSTITVPADKPPRQRAIAQRFRALAHRDANRCLLRCRLRGEHQTRCAHFESCRSCPGTATNIVPRFP